RGGVALGTLAGAAWHTGRASSKAASQSLGHLGPTLAALEDDAGILQSRRRPPSTPTLASFNKACRRPRYQTVAPCRYTQVAHAICVVVLESANKKNPRTLRSLWPCSVSGRPLEPVCRLPPPLTGHALPRIDQAGVAARP